MIEIGPDRKGLETGVLCINAFIHIFCPFNTAEGPTRWRYFSAYFIEVVEALVSLLTGLNQFCFRLFIILFSQIKTSISHGS